MGFFKNLVTAYRAASAIRNSGNRITTSEDLADWMRGGGAMSKSGARVTPDTAMQQGTVYACVRVLAESVAHLPLSVYQRDGDRRLLDRASPVQRLLHSRPNEWQTSFEWRELGVTDLELRGNHYSLIVRGFGDRVVELIRLHPDRVVPKQDPTTLEVTYEYTRPGGKRVILPRRQVLHVRGLGSDGVVGLGTVQYQRETIGDAIAVQDHGSRFFSNGAKSLAALRIPTAGGGDINSEQIKALRADFESLYSGPENAFKTAILPAGVEYEQLSMSLEDSQFIETRGFSRSEIAAIFRLPPHKVGDLTHSTFSNIEHQGLEFVTDSLTPRLVRWETAIHRDLLDSDPARFVEFDVNALLRGDFRSRQEGLQIQRRNGIINANEWRETEGLNPRTDPGAAEYIVEQNMREQDGAPSGNGDQNA